MHLIRSLAVVAVFAPLAFAQTPVSPSPATQPLLMPMTGGPAPTTAPATQSADETAVRAALEKYNTAVAAGDTDALMKFVVVSSPQQKSALALMGRLTTVGRGMFDSVQGKYGDKALAEANVDRGSFPAGFPALPADQIDVKVTGDRANLLVRASADAPPLSMKKADGEWKLDGDALLPAMTDKQLAEQSAILTAAMGEIEQSAADVKAGHFRAPDEAVAVMNLRVQKAVRLAQVKLAAAEATTEPATMPAK